jgi:hypothetical protein
VLAQTRAAPRRRAQRRRRRERAQPHAGREHARAAVVVLVGGDGGGRTRDARRRAVPEVHEHGYAQKLFLNRRSRGVVVGPALWWRRRRELGGRAVQQVGWRLHSSG